MTLKLYGFPASSGVKRVAVICREKNVPFELVLVDVFGGEHQTEAFKAKQPFGLVPYIDDDGFILYESRAIASYIAKKYADQGTQGLIPSDPKAHALFEQALQVEAFHFDPPLHDLAVEKLFASFRGAETDEARVTQLLATLNTKLDVYETILGRQKYLAGDSVTLADLYHLPYGALIGKMQLDVIEKRPNVARWWKDISSRPSWVSVQADLQ